MAIPDEDLPVIPTDVPARECQVDNMTPDQIDQLPPVRGKFAIGFLDQMAGKFGHPMLLVAMYQIEKRIASGDLVDLLPSRAWKILEGTLRRLHEEARIKKAEEVRCKALWLLFQNGERYKIGGRTISMDATGWWVDGRPSRWISDFWLADLARKNGWKVEAETKAGKKDLEAFLALKADHVTPARA